MPSQKILTILRHAKAHEGKAGQDDHERTLNERGAHAAKEMGKYLAKEKLRPDLVLCSTATRTAETLMKLEEAVHPPMAVEYTDKLYLASANAMLTLIASVPDDVSKLMLIGHNPGLHQLAYKLARPNHKLSAKLAEKFPTCALAEIDLGKIHWRDVAKTKGELEAVCDAERFGLKKIPDSL